MRWLLSAPIPDGLKTPADLYMIAFGPLRNQFNSRELKGIADTMVERGLRLRADFDELFDGWNCSDTGDDESLDELDDATRDAQELRRLMPY